MRAFGPFTLQGWLMCGLCAATIGVPTGAACGPIGMAVGAVVGALAFAIFAYRYG